MGFTIICIVDFTFLIMLFYALQLVIVRQPSSYILHRLLKFFFRWIPHPHGIYNASITHICRISRGYPWAIRKNWTNSKWPSFGEGQTLNWHHFRQNRSSFLILVSTVGFSDMPDLVVCSEITLDIALWVTFKMATICPRSNNKLILFSTQ